MVLTICDLNSDCLERIFRLFNLHEQIKLSRVCRCFRNVIIDQIWERSPIFQTFVLSRWIQWIPTHEDLVYFLQLTSHCIRRVFFEEFCLLAFLEDLEDLNIKLLPNVEYFSWSVLHADCHTCDDEILKLSLIMPNLRCLKITPPITGRYLANFKQLEELYLFENEEKDFEIGDEYLCEICTTQKNLRVLDLRHYEFSRLNLFPVLSCGNLQVLRVNLNMLRPVLQDILRLMTNLRVLTIRVDANLIVSNLEQIDVFNVKINETDEFFEILKSKADRIVSLILDNGFMALGPGWDQNLDIWRYKKLQKFCLSSWPYKAEETLARFMEMKDLRILSLRHWIQINNELVAHAVKNLPKLLHLDLSFTFCLTKDLLYDLLDYLKAEKRTLYLYYSNSGLVREIESENFYFWRKQKDFLICYDEQLPSYDVGKSCVYRGFEFEFD